MSLTKHDFPIEIEDLTIEQKTGVLYSKIRLYYMLKVFVEDNEILRARYKGCLAHLHAGEQQLQKIPESEKEKRYAELQKNFATCLERVNRMLSLFPHMITMEKEDFEYLLEL